MCAQKLMNNQLNTPHETKKTERVMKKIKNKKTQILRRNGLIMIREVHGVSPEAGREFVVQTICER